ncbi:MAG TPA: Asp-tRNA(Asn)/Glu-tRNA(Gln) amidotransferase subunit GatB [Cyclobacteriaceae bacterium]|nr:Asp-tRNA(Asn)/Glu-tRNA(Gln) amidotransferase subunit GatB [Cyclobacteriaceae bacterium]
MDQAIRNKYTAVIGLEVHAQLSTQSKIYNSDSSAYGAPPNSQVSVITLAHPGTLPKLNKSVVEYAVKMGLACHCDISRSQIFDRKNYFYPDLPKGYQITQDRTPICKNGYVAIKTRSGVERNINLHRIHIEEDAGKSIHVSGEKDTQVDFNRAGVALVEIVTLPVLKDGEEAFAFLTEVRKLVRYLDICDGNMEEGSLRCDANISIMPHGSTTLGKKVEVKNMNSMRNVQHAIEHEIDRQIKETERGNAIISETRTYDADAGLTHGMRAKEELNDYRYFPDPDLSPLSISNEWLESIRSSMPALPSELYSKFVTQYHLPEYDAHVLTESKELSQYFEAVCSHTKNYKAVSNWIMGPVKGFLNEKNADSGKFVLAPGTLAQLIELIDKGSVSFTVASQTLFPALIGHPEKDPQTLAEELNLIQDSDADSILPLVNEVIKEFPLKVEEYKKGKKGIVAMFMGEVMKRSRGKADPKMANALVIQKLNEQ